MKPADFPDEVHRLIGQLKELPGIGPRSAERICLWLLQNPHAHTEALVDALSIAKERIAACPTCGFFATATHCVLCDNPQRNQAQICVIEQATDVMPLERSGVFHGHYHCLGGKLSPLDGVEPEDLRIPSLLKRIDDASAETEVILALGSDVEGEATANYLADLLRQRRCRISRIAQGLPVGGGLGQADPLTLMRALQGRRSW